MGIHTFKGRSEDELTVEKGDYIEVLEDDSAFNDSWYFGRNLTSFGTGLFPKAFTTNVISLPPDVQKRVAIYDAKHPPQPAADLSQNMVPQPVVPSTPAEKSAPTNQQVYSGNASPAAHAAAQAAARASSNSNGSGRRPSESSRVTSGSNATKFTDDIFNDSSSGSPGGIVPSAPRVDNLNINDNTSAGSSSTAPSSTAPLASPSVSALNVDKSQNGSRNGSVDRASNANSAQEYHKSFLNSYNGVPIADAESPNINSVTPLETPHSSSSQVGVTPARGASALPVDTAPPIADQSTASVTTLSSAPVVAPSPQTVLGWTPAQVEAYFLSKGLDEDAPKFAQQKVTGAILLEMDRETLKEIDIMGFGPRFEIEREIKMLRGYAGMSPSVDSPASPSSPAVSYGSSMGSLMSTPVMQQPGYFNYGMPQPGASTATLSPYPNNGMNTYGNRSFSGGSGMISPVIPQGQPGMAARSPPQTFQFQSPQPQPQNVMQPTYMTQSSPYLAQQPPPSQYQQYRQQSQANLAQQQQQQQQQQQPSRSQGRGQQIPQIPQSQQQQQRLARQQQDNSTTPSQPINIAKHKKGNSSVSSHGAEEVTGSLNSNFSVPPSQSATGAQAASRGGGHHRQSSSMSRYSVGPQSAHRRSRTLDDWESGLLPASSETNLRNPSHSHHQRNISLGSNMSGRSGNRNATGYESDSIKYLSHSRNGSTDSSKQNRRSSIFSRLSGSPKKKPSLGTFEVLPTNNIKGSPAPNLATPNGSVKSPSIGSPSTVTALDSPQTSNGSANANSQRRISSDNAFSKLRPTLQKTKTSAFQEGIKNVTADQAASTALKSGWMHKRGGNSIGVWSKRYFTLHDTRLSYFASFKDTKEKGLIDITGYRVVPVKDHELLVSLTAAGMGAGRHCFKLVPPGPGYKKGVAFTAPKVHYFAVDSADEMREWQNALMSATIERDESAPVLSTCQLPTISLPKAQELMAERLKTKGDIGSLTK